MHPPLLDRRTFIQALTLASAASVTSAESKFASQKRDIPVVRTTGGNVSGSIDRGVFTYKGIPYASSPEGPNRFMPPRPVRPWQGVRPALVYAPCAIQSVDLPRSSSERNQNSPEIKAFGSLFSGAAPNQKNYESEDCLYLNVWTPSAGENANRPVMVWLHGGGFSGGCSDRGWIDGANLARKHNVVAVSLNHRLNVFGHLFLSEIAGERYADSGNVGMLDIVCALHWVQENIRSFGGSPDNVTIFGTSGGGGKVVALMAMPSARGMFHKAIVQSGPYLKGIEPEDATRTTLHLLQYLGIRPNQIHELHNVPAKRLIQATHSVVNSCSYNLDWLSDWISWNKAFAPVVDSSALPHHPFHPTAPCISSSVPMIVGSTGAELSSYDHAFGEEELAFRMKILGFDNRATAHLLESYRSRRPGASSSDVFYAIASDKLCRMYSIKQAERKALQQAAPVYMYLFQYSSPAFGGKFKSFHGIEVPAVFDNAVLAPGLAVDPHYDLLAQKISRAWTAFALTGNPNHSNLPNWPAYSLEERATMVFDRECVVMSDPGGSDRQIMEQYF